MAEDLVSRARENHLLAGVDAEELSRLLLGATVVGQEFRSVLYRRGDQVRYVYFPLSGLYSLLAPTANSDTVEVGTVGREGFIGIGLHLGVETAYCTAIAQVPGETIRVDGETFEAEMKRCETATRVLGRYIYALYVQTVQWVACNRLHSLDERFARWLLSSADTLGSESLPLTHDFLAKMLGVRRPSVTLAAGALQRAGLIESSRGMIRIVNREGLENISCDCYRLVRDHYDALLSRNEREREGARTGSR